MKRHLRIARPVTNIDRAAAQYCQALELRVLADFRDHDGFDGVILGSEEADYHLEFTQNRLHPVAPRPTPEDLLVFYCPHESQWRLACGRMETAGFKSVSSTNPYWDVHGRTYEDRDGYRVVLQQEAWNPAAQL
jgi:hypothetical protein